MYVRAMTTTELLTFQTIFCRRCTVKPCRIKLKLAEIPPELIPTEGYMAPYMCQEFKTHDKWVMQGVKEKLEGMKCG
jgi:hypothetical protein